LERDLHEAQFNKHLKESEVTAQTQIIEERRELHDRLKATSTELEQLQSQVRSRDNEIRSRRKHERELESQLRSLQNEKQQVDSQATSAKSELERVSRKYQRAVEQSVQLQQAWDEERKAIRQRVHFSESTGKREDAKSSKTAEEAERSIQQAEKRHQAEIKGLAKQIRYLKAKAAREATFRSDLTFSKNFFLMQIQLYSSWYVTPLLFHK
jgi:chromosome segregation ATPase